MNHWIPLPAVQGNQRLIRSGRWARSHRPPQVGGKGDRKRQPVLVQRPGYGHVAAKRGSARCPWPRPDRRARGGSRAGVVAGPAGRAPRLIGLSLPTSLMAGYEPTRFWRRDTAERAKNIFCWFSLYLPLVAFSYLEGPLAPGGSECTGPRAMAEPKAGGAQANGPRGCGRGVAPGKRRTAPVPKAVKSAAAGLTSLGLDGPFTGGV